TSVRSSWSTASSRSPLIVPCDSHSRPLGAPPDWREIRELLGSSPHAPWYRIRDIEVMSAETPDSEGKAEASHESETEPSHPQATEAPAKFPIVGIGASAGGLEALEALTRRLASDGMAYIVLQHLAPGHESILTEILARGTSLRVVTVHDGIVVKPSIIYVAPP